MFRNLILKSTKCTTARYFNKHNMVMIRKNNFCTTTTNNNTNNNNSTTSTNTNINKTNKKNVISNDPPVAVEKSIYGSIGDMEFTSSKNKAQGPSSQALTKEQLSKSLLLMRKSGTLSSVNMMAKMENEQSTPVYGSLSPYALHESIEEVAGDITNEHVKESVTVYNPIICLKSSSPHIKHFKHFSKVSLVVYPLTPFGRSPSEYDLPRVNFSGRMNRVSRESDLVKYNSVKKTYFEKHPNSIDIINNEDHEFYIMEISDVYYYERNSKLSLIPIEVFKTSKSDPITIQSREIIETVNSKYQSALSIIVEQYGDVKLDDSFIYLVDSFGLNCIGKKKGIEEWLDIRIPFDAPFDTFENCKLGLYDTLKSIQNKNF